MSRLGFLLLFLLLLLTPQQLFAAQFLARVNHTSANQTLFAMGSGNATESVVSWGYPEAGRIKNLFVKCNTSVSAGSLTFTIRLGESTDTALTCQITSGQQCSVTADVDFAAEELVSLKLVTAAASPSLNTCFASGTILTQTNTEYPSVTVWGNVSALAPADGNFCGPGVQTETADVASRCNTASEDIASFVVPFDGTIESLTVKEGATLNAATSETFTVRNVTDAVDTDIAVLFNNTSDVILTETCTSNCAVTAGERLVVRFNKTGTIKSTTRRFALTIDGGGQIQTRNRAARFGTTAYTNFYDAFSTTINTLNVARADRNLTLSDLFVWNSAVPISSFTTTICSGSTSPPDCTGTRPSCQVTDAQTTCSDVVNSVAVPQGEFYYIQVTAPGVDSENLHISFQAEGEATPTPTATAVDTSTATATNTGATATSTNTPTPGNTATGTVTQTATVTQTPAPTPCTTIIPPIVVEELSDAAPNSSLTITLDGGDTIDACHDIFVVLSYRRTNCCQDVLGCEGDSSGLPYCGATFPSVTDTNGNTYQCKGIPGLILQGHSSGFGCDEDEQFFEQPGLVICRSAGSTGLSPGSQITVHNINSTTGVDLVSVIDIGNLDATNGLEPFNSLSAGIGSTTLDPNCLCSPNGVSSTIGGILECYQDFFPGFPPMGYYFGKEIAPTSFAQMVVPEGSMVFYAMNTLTDFTPLAGSTELTNFGSDHYLTALYKIMPSTDETTLGGNSSGDIAWSSFGFIQQPQCNACTPMITTTPTITPTPTPTPTPTGSPVPCETFRLILPDPITDPPSQAWAEELVRRLRNYRFADGCPTIE